MMGRPRKVVVKGEKWRNVSSKTIRTRVYWWDGVYSLLITMSNDELKEAYELLSELKKRKRAVSSAGSPSELEGC